MTQENSKIKFYGTTWCGDCRRSFFYLKRKNIPFDNINIDDDGEGENIVKSLNNGNRSVPTIVFPDGSFLVEPSNQQIAEKLNIPL
ncbi:MAG: NrdH-redoxin [Anaerolineaceae bacterium]|nr:NrdH-redoxin [Anaerolineaceae bacterium]